ncbi:MAG: AraC family transcriptional regulator [Fimbriimonadales bacterium]
MDDIRYYLLEMGSIANRLYVGHSALVPGRKEWTQPADLWSFIAYEHSGVVHLNNQSYAFEPLDMVVVPPGAVAGHDRIGEGTFHIHMTFDAPSSGERRAIPAFTKLSLDMMRNFETAYFRSSTSGSASKAFVRWLAWDIAQPVNFYRSRQELYEAEEWIRSNLHRPFSVAEMTDQLRTPYRTLLRWFEAEHRMTMAQFIRQTRARSAISLITDTDLSLKEIAAKVGMTNLQQFNKLVRSEIGISPSELRRRAEEPGGHFVPRLSHFSVVTPPKNYGAPEPPNP